MEILKKSDLTICPLCRSKGATEETCPLNKSLRNPVDYSKHTNVKRPSSRVANSIHKLLSDAFKLRKTTAQRSEAQRSEVQSVQSVQTKELIQIPKARRPRKVFTDITPVKIDYGYPEFIRLEELTMTHYKDLVPIVNIESIMENIAGGEIWSPKKLEEKLRASQEEWVLNSKGRAYFWAIMYNSLCIGIVGFYSPRGKITYVLRILLSDKYQGKGIGKIALKMAINSMIVLRPDLKQLHASTHMPNYRSKLLLLKSGFKYVNKSKIGNTAVVNYVYNITETPLNSQMYIKLPPYHKELQELDLHYNELWRDITYTAVENMLTKINPGTEVIIEYKEAWMLEDINAIWTQLKEFPYKKKYLKAFYSLASDLITENNRRIRSGSPWDTDTRENHLAIVTRYYPLESGLLDSITDIIAEPIRIRCQERNKISPLMAWDKIKDLPHIKILSVQQKRQEVYKIARGCNLFNISLGIYLLTGNGQGIWDPVDGPGDVLDPAAGWGDRLGAAFISKAKSYDGWDTNPDLQPVYKELAVNFMNLKLNLNWNVVAAPFETADLKGKKYDTVLTSPPFFNVEEYEGDETSTTKYNTKEDWIQNYYRPMLNKAADALKVNGRFILYISDGWMVEKAQFYLNRSGLTYVGSVGFQQVDKSSSEKSFIRNAYIWINKVGHGKPETGQKIPQAQGKGPMQAQGKGPMQAQGKGPMQAQENANISKSEEYMKRIFAAKEGINYSSLLMTNTGEFSVTKKADGILLLKSMKTILKTFDDKTITDLTANVGGDTILFGLNFKSVRSIEIDEVNFNALKNNVKVFNLSNVQLFKGDSTRIYTWPTDVLYIDPPWGGPEYGKRENIDLYLGNRRIDEYLTWLLEQKWKPKFIFMKLPKNYNYDRFSSFKYKIFDNRKFNLVSFKI